MKIKVKLDKGAYMPEIAHRWDAGADLRTPERVVVHPHSSAVIDTGVHVEIPKCCVGMIKSKSGLNVNHDLTSEGVVDCGFTGSIVCKLYNHGSQPHVFEQGDKITQLVIMPLITPDFEQVDSLEETERGNSGFGSTGR